MHNQLGNAFKKRIWEILEIAKSKQDWVSRFFDIFIISLIALNVIAVIIGTVSSVEKSYGIILEYFEVFSVSIFTVEYILRQWSCTASSKFSSPVVGRIKHMLTFMSVCDLLAILPFYLSFGAFDLRVLRAFRLFRILRLAKVGRYYNSLELMKKVLISKRPELILSSFMLTVLLVLSSSIMYYVENQSQPEAFSSIPATMWWAVATLTTVGYGDIYPISVFGKMLGAIIAILGVGMFALPAGIIASGFVEEIQKKKDSVLGKKICPKCGESLE